MSGGPDMMRHRPPGPALVVAVVVVVVVVVVCRRCLPRSWLESSPRKSPAGALDQDKSSARVFGQKPVSPKAIGQEPSSAKVRGQRKGVTRLNATGHFVPSQRQAFLGNLV